MSDADLEAILSQSSGARFVRADLHIHTYGGSADVTEEAMTPSGVAEVARLQRIRIVGFTDHNRPGDVAAKAAVSSAELLVLLGVELSTSGGHLLCLFPQANLVGLERLLAVLKVEPNGFDDVATTASMADAMRAVDENGGLAVPAHVDAPLGLETVSSGFGAIKRTVLHSPYLSGLEIRDPANATWYTSADPEGARFALVKQRADIKPTQTRAGIARIRGSDAHELARVGRGADGTSRLTLLKVEQMTFEAVRLALRDPEARVRLEEEIPTSYPRVVGLRVEGGFLADWTQRLSDNLTCFIGGRGTGKSTVLETLRWVLGHESREFEAQEGRSPDRATAFIQTDSSTVFRVERGRGGQPRVTLDGVEQEATFQIEAYSQGEIAGLASEPIDLPDKLLAFADRFIEGARELRRQIAAITAELELSDEYVVRAEAKTTTLDAVTKELADIDTRIRAAEAGDLKKLVELRKQLAAAQTRREAVRSAAQAAAGAFSDASDRSRVNIDPVARTEVPAYVVSAIDSFNEVVRTGALEMRHLVAKAATELLAQLETWGRADAAIERQVAESEAELEAKGLKANIRWLQSQFERRTALEKSRLEMEETIRELGEHFKERSSLLQRLSASRSQLGKARDRFAATVASDIRDVLPGGAVTFGFQHEGLPRAYFDLLADVLTGTHLHDETLKGLARRLAPEMLRQFVNNRNVDALATAETTKGQVLGRDAAADIIVFFRRRPAAIHRLEHVGRDDMPVVYFVAGQAKWPLDRLSKGQRHTILLAIAFASERECPLLMDQPEDELDNAFVFQRVVGMLRRVKGRRQVVIVSHNANIVVLGDAELICVLGRSNADRAELLPSGALDAAQVREQVINVLEGGEVAFRRRREMYGL